MLITEDKLRKITLAGTNNSRMRMTATLINRICPQYGITDKKALAVFIAQTAHESQNFTRLKENLNYSEPRLLQVFSKYFNNKTAASYAGKPESIANRVYANRMGNGNEASGDGWANRGGGYIQLTGLDMYRKYADYKKESVEEIREKVRTHSEYAFDSACWCFVVDKKLLPLAKQGDITTTTRRINGGLNGLADRKAIYERALKIL